MNLKLCGLCGLLQPSTTFMADLIGIYIFVLLKFVRAQNTIKLQLCGLCGLLEPSTAFKVDLIGIVY